MNPRPWIRLWCKEVDDPRMRLLAFEDRYHYIALKCLKGQGHLEFGGDQALFVRKVAVRIGVQVRELDEIARRLSEVGLIDRETFQPLSWDQEQAPYAADPTAAERKRRQRSRERNVTLAECHGVTPVTRSAVTQVTTLDVDVDEDEEAEGSKSQTTTCAPLDWSNLEGLDTRVVVDVLASCVLSAERQQDVLDELAGARRKGVIKSSLLGWVKGVAQNATRHDFTLLHGVEIKKARTRRLVEEEEAAKRRAARASAAARLADPDVRAATCERIRELQRDLGSGDSR